MKIVGAVRCVCAGLLAVCAVTACARADGSAADYTGEHILYSLSVMGKAEYDDRGVVPFAGGQARLVTFRTQAAGFKDLEKIYVDLETGLPLRVERQVAFLLRKEYLVEEYDASAHTLVIRKYVRDKLVKSYRFKKSGPIHNAVLLPFYLRGIPDLLPGWSMEVRFPQAFKVTLADRGELVVPAGRFKALHFTSKPRKFELWISDDRERIPLKIKGSGPRSYTMVMRSRSVHAP